MSKLLLISLGPIQDFIATARRCQDLWFGSWLLSDLSRVVAGAVQSHGGPGCSLILPAGLAASEQTDREQPGVANKILARLSDDAIDAGAVVAAAKSAMTDRIQQIADLAWNFQDRDAKAFDRKRAQRQIDEMMEFLWVAVEEQPGKYAEARADAERRLAAVKNTRLWCQPSWHEPNGPRLPKSSLDGERESVIHEVVYDTWSSDRLRGTFGVKGKERLCGIGLLKRRGCELDEEGSSRIFKDARPAFHSTSHVAMTPLLNRFQRPEAQAAVRAYREELEAIGLNLDRFRIRRSRRSHRGHEPVTLSGLDGVLLLKSRFKDHLQENPAQRDREWEKQQLDGAVRDAERALAELLRSVDFSGEPCPYYAFLLADGDQMGKAIDGIPTFEGHQALGRALSRFTLQCREIVERHQGSLIFSGGDDVLALLPLHTAISCARVLADLFQQIVQPEVDKHWRPTPQEPKKPKTTLSVGLGISHCREPMGDARQLAQRAEKEAKKSRNALAIVVAKRSGGDLTVSGEWEEDYPLDDRIDDWLEVLAAELSAKTAHDLEEIAAHYELLPPDAQVERIDEIRSLVKQVLERKRQKGGGQDASRKAEDEILFRLERPSKHAAYPAATVRTMSAELQIARLFAQARRDADLPADFYRDLAPQRPRTARSPLKQESNP